MLSVALCALVCVFGLSGCDFMLGETDSLLRSPEPLGEHAEISKALESTVGKKFVLKSPKYGDWRTAFVVRDMDGDEVDEALAFYSLDTDGVAELHMSIIGGDNGDWKVLGDLQLGGTDVERIDFGDLDGDGAEEVAVAWSIYGAPETRLTVLSPNEETPVPLYEGSYTDFCIYDMTESEGDELMVFVTDLNDKTTRCSLLYGEGGKLNEGGAALLSSSIATVRKFHKTELDGKPTVYIDATTADGGYFTEIVTVEGDKLSAPMAQSGGKANVITGRYQPINCGDVNGDNSLEIPCMTVLPNGGNSDGTLYLTEWKEYRDGRLTTVEKSVVSKLMQYKIKVDSGWQGKFSCVYTGENDGTDLYIYNAKKGLGDKVLSVIAVPKEGFDIENHQGMFIIDENSKTVYLGRLYNDKNSLGITRSEVKKIFSQNITEGTEE